MMKAFEMIICALLIIGIVVWAISAKCAPNDPEDEMYNDIKDNGQ